MSDIARARLLLDEINRAISGYDPVLKERARDILLERAFGGARAGPPEGDERRRSASARSGPAVEDPFVHWRPESGPERALGAAYAVCGGRPGRIFTSQAVNAELKRRGLPVKNITRAIEGNLRTRPPFVVQRKKLGSTRQARKQYALTEEGVEHVEARAAPPEG